MNEFERVGFRGHELRALNRVRMHQQCIFLSDVLGVSGKSIDPKYL